MTQAINETGNVAAGWVVTDIEGPVNKHKPGVLSDDQITEWASSGGIKPFDHRLVNPASIDLRWSGKSRCAYHWGWSEVEDSNELLVIPGLLYLLDTVEYIEMPDDTCGVLYLKSSMGRAGLEHLHAGFVDPSFTGSLTLEITNVAPWNITLSRGQRIVQLQLQRLESKPRLSYLETGRYNYQNEPTIAR